jgi:hypothetical protein
VTVAETARSWVALAAKAETEAIRPVATRASAREVRFMVVPFCAVSLRGLHFPAASTGFAVFRVVEAILRGPLLVSVKCCTKPNVFNGKELHATAVS